MEVPILQKIGQPYSMKPPHLLSFDMRTARLSLLLPLFILLGIIVFAYIPKSVFIPETSISSDVAVSGARTNSSLQSFVHSVTNGQSDTVVGIYVPGVLALPVGQQPKGNTGFVTREPNVTTQFSLAGNYGTVGVLAHNDLAGSQFDGIKLNQYAIVVYGDGHLDYYMINDVQKYQALTPTSTFSDFINLDGSDERLSAGQLFNRVYAPGDRLVFQTCIAAYGDPSWGRVFFIAQPATSQVLSVVRQTSFLLNFVSLGLASR
jgi:hypothetical protein